MAVIGLTLDAVRVHEFSKDPDKGTPAATKWKIGTLDSRIMGKIRDLATSITVDPTSMDDEVETSINQNDVFFNAVSYGLRGWENFQDAKKNDIQWRTKTRRHSGVEYEVVDPDMIKLIPHAVLQELAQEIMAENEVTEQEGNVSAPPSSPSNSSESETA